jgi:heme exporter protein B
MTPLILRELRLAATGGNAVLPIIFFLLVATLFPFAVGPDAPCWRDRRRSAVDGGLARRAAARRSPGRAGPGERRARSARRSRHQRGGVAIAKLAGHWLSFGPPLMLAAVPAAALMKLPQDVFSGSSSAFSSARRAWPR